MHSGPISEAIRSEPELLLIKLAGISNTVRRRGRENDFKLIFFSRSIDINSTRPLESPSMERVAIASIDQEIGTYHGEPTDSKMLRRYGDNARNIVGWFYSLIG